MIDLVQAKEVFSKYVNEFDVKDPKIDLKIRHTFHVQNLSEYLAEKIGLNDEDFRLASLIGLLHDIGRFEQLKENDSYFDFIGWDHADYGIKLLFDDGMIRKFVEEDIYDEIIRKAIYHHNKISLVEDGLTEREILFAKIIRDSDKLDNYRVKVNDTFEAIIGATQEEVENSTYTEKIFEDFKKEQLIVSKECKTIIDFWLSFLAFTFDLNFKESYIYLKENDYINREIDRINYKDEKTKEMMEEARVILHKYIDRKLNEEGK